MPTERPQRSMQTPLTNEQISTVLRVSELGLQWVAGKISIEQVESALGKLEGSNINGESSYYYDKGDFGANFDLLDNNEKRRIGVGRSFGLRSSVVKSAHVPRETLEQQLGLHRNVPGELIDGVRREHLAYLAKPILETQAPDEVALNSRLPMPPGSPFDVRVRLVYRTISNRASESDFGTAANLRSITIERWYLTPAELQEREDAKRQRYGRMDLRTGKLCPETGWWEGWTKHNVVDKQVIRGGEKFPQARLPPPGEALNGAWFADAQWIWHGPFKEAS
ncbi:conserved hypothetical protein [Burkholderia sp. 8Y]|uniref:hypothetical protein n=1 Tax=Burkholderia sp. 8Y TaxID=2653133 RepID=UPI0012F028B2|nr:hypothetical protein [Burkholderia sp. 8Y]VXB50297.1 conserved hypothetical protein [Burkholderia sp. 8Y]